MPEKWRDGNKIFILFHIIFSLLNSEIDMQVTG